jgi:hypothetical protein
MKPPAAPAYKRPRRRLRGLSSGRCRRLDRYGDPSRCRDDAELDEHAQLIDETPVLGEAPIDGLTDVDLGPGGSFARCRDAREVSVMVPVADRRWTTWSPETVASSIV